MTTLIGDSVGTLKRRWWVVYPDPTSERHRGEATEGWGCWSWLERRKEVTWNVLSRK